MIENRSIRRKGRRARLILATALMALLASGCSVRKYAIGKIGDALAGSGSTFASDDDPQLIKEALPFSLKLIESLLAETPEHRGLLLAAASGFTQYVYSFILEEADETMPRDFAAAMAMQDRARRLLLRARDYGLRGLETKHRGISTALPSGPRAALGVAGREDVPLLYWTASSWGLAISISKNQPDLVADQPVVEALIDRALELDETFDHGAIHTFLITYEMSRRDGEGDPAAWARKHFERAMELSGGYQAAPLVALAESVSIAEQNREEFRSLLEQALAIDPDAHPEVRLANLIMQRRARWLLSRIDELFLVSGPQSPEKGKPLGRERNDDCRSETLPVVDGCGSGFPKGSFAFPVFGLPAGAAHSNCREKGI